MDFTLEQQAVGQSDLAPQSNLKGGVEGAVANPDFSLPPLQTQDAGGVINSLVKVAEKVLAPSIKRSEQAAFMDGMARAAAGQAAKEIEAQRPAWASIFGEGAATAGARAYEGMADGATFETWAASSMKEARKLAPLEYSKLLQKQITTMQTGDPIRDQQIQGIVLKSVPALMKQHAKEHVAYNQEVAWKARGNAISGALRAYGAWAAEYRKDPSKFTPEDVDRVRQTTLATLAPFPVEDVEMRDKQLSAILKGELAGGNFDAFHLLRDTGVLAGVPIAERDDLERMYRTEASRELPNRVSDGTMRAVVDLSRDLTQTDATLSKNIEAINSRARAETGIDYDLIQGSKRDDIMARLEAAREADKRAKDVEARRIAAKREADAKDAAKEEAKALLRQTHEAVAKRTILNQDVLTGKIAEGGAAAVRQGAIMAPGYSDVEDAVATNFWTITAGDPKARAAILLNRGASHPVEQARGEFRSLVTKTAWDANVDLLVSVVDAMPKPNGPDGSPAHTLSAYLSSDDYDQVREYQRLVASGLTKQEAWTTAREARSTRPSLRNKPLDEGAEAAIEETLKAGRGWFSSQPSLTAQGLEFRRQAMRASYATAIGSNPAEKAAVAMALTGQQFRDIDNAFTYMKQGNAKDLGKYVGDPPPADLSRAVRSLLEDRGVGADSLTHVFLTEFNGRGVLRSQIMKPDADGVPRPLTITITSTDIINRLMKQQEELAASKVRKSTADYIAP